MKLRVTMKDPDTLIDAVDDAYRELVKEFIEKGLSERAANAAADAETEEMREFASRFFKYGEYLTVELDHKAGTINVVEKV